MHISSQNACLTLRRMLATHSRVHANTLCTHIWDGTITQRKRQPLKCANHTAQQEARALKSAHLTGDTSHHQCGKQQKLCDVCVVCAHAQERITDQVHTTQRYTSQQQSVASFSKRSRVTKKEPTATLFWTLLDGDSKRDVAGVTCGWFNRHVR